MILLMMMIIIIIIMCKVKCTKVQALRFCIQAVRPIWEVEV